MDHKLKVVAFKRYIFHTLHTFPAYNPSIMDNFVRSHEAVQVVCAAIVPSLKSILGKWHQQKQTVLGHCTSPQSCKSKGKPVVKKSCQSCIQWGQAIEAAYYPQSNTKSIPWSNINPTLLGKDYVEATKAYTLKLQKGNIYKDLVDYDAASLLMIMQCFEPFHQGDNTFVDKIKKVRNARFDQKP